MKVSIIVEQRQDYIDEIVLKGYNNSRRYIAEMPVSKQVIPAITLMEEYWKRAFEHPPIMVDTGGHGNDSGLILITGVEKEIKEYQRVTYTNRVLARVSFGSRHEPSDGTTLHFDDIQRYHISVLVSKTFKPINYDQFKRKFKTIGHDSEARYLGIDEEKLHSSIDSLTINETTHISMRWLKRNGIWTYDDWSDTNAYGKELENPEMQESIMVKQFHKGRTIYFISRAEFSDYNINSGMMHAPVSFSIYTQPEEIQRKYRDKLHDLIPTVGYDALSQNLSCLPKVSSEELREMSMEEGTIFLLRDVFNALRGEFIDK